MTAGPERGCLSETGPIGTPEGRGVRVARQLRPNGLPHDKSLAVIEPLRFRRMVSVLTISGMLAVHSKRAVFTALSGVPGVGSAEVEMGRAVVEHEASTTSQSLVEAIALAGCEVTSVRIERRLPLTGA